MKEKFLASFEHILNENGITLPEYVKLKIHIKEYSANSMICSVGEVVHNIQWVLEGELIITNIFADGSEYVFASEKALTVLGDMEFFSRNYMYATSVIAKTNIVLLQIDFDVFSKWLREDKILYDFVIYQMAIKCYKGTIKQGNIKYENSKKRVTKMLLALAQPSKKQEGLYQVECSHYELAKMTGMSERTVARLLKELQSGGHVKLEYKRILINGNLMNE